MPCECPPIHALPLFHFSKEKLLFRSSGIAFKHITIQLLFTNWQEKISKLSHVNTNSAVRVYANTNGFFMSITGHSTCFRALRKYSSPLTKMNKAKAAYKAVTITFRAMRKNPIGCSWIPATGAASTKVPCRCANKTSRSVAGSMYVLARNFMH